MPLRWSIPHPVVAGRQPPLVMGILNVTPDSFSDGGRFASTRDAVARAWEIAEEGADLLDVGGESTRPGSEPVPAEEERARVEPVVRELLAGNYPLPISIDTTKSEVAGACLEAGACVVNDVTALRGDSAMAPLIARANAAVVLMHMLGTPKTMQQNPIYADVTGEIRDFLRERAEWAIQQGIPRERIILDPGIGFGKTLEHNVTLLGNIESLRADLDAPILIGASRKRFLGWLLDDAPAGERLEGSLAAAAAASWQHAEVLRVHDVSETVRFLRVLRPILNAMRKTD